MIRYIGIGHFSLYKNDKKINESFMKFKNENGELQYKKVYRTDESFFFDETGRDNHGIVKFFDNTNYKLYNNTSVIADVSVKYNNFIISTLGNTSDGKYIFEYKIENDIGKLVGYYNINKHIEIKEYMYIHLQKRKMLVNVTNSKNYLIIPNSFIDNTLEKIALKDFKKLTKKVTKIRKEYLVLKTKSYLKNSKLRRRKLYWKQNNTIIEDNVKIYQNVTIGRSDIYKPYKDSKMKNIIIKENAIICAGAKKLCKEGTLTIGKNSIVAANAVLLNSIGDNEV